MQAATYQNTMSKHINFIDIDIDFLHAKTRRIFERKQTGICLTHQKGWGKSRRGLGNKRF